MSNDLLVPLSQLATRIDEAHTLAEACLRTGLAHARSAGQLLLQAKSQCKHGEWLSWLQDNVSFSRWTAQSYMRIAQRWKELEMRDASRISYRDALKLLAAPSENPVQATDVPESSSQPPWPLAADKEYWVPSVDNTAFAEIMLHADDQRWCWVAVFGGLHTDKGWIEYTRRGIRAEPAAVAGMLQSFGFQSSTTWIEEDRTEDVPFYIKPIEWTDDEIERERKRQEDVLRQFGVAVA